MTALADGLAGRISPQVAIARMLLAGMDRAAIGIALAAAPSPAAAAMRALLDARGPALDALAQEVAATAAAHDATGPDGPARIAAFFDRAVRHSPEASVALYSLGDPAILAAATAEIVAFLTPYLRQGADVLDLGCGIGRMAMALAPHARSVLALDVSAGMVAEARRRTAGLPHIRVEQTRGTDLDFLPQAALDLVLATDSFPYIVQSGLALRHVQGAARALRPGGALVILNLSYRGDDALDRTDATGWAAATGMHLVHPGHRPFRLWDGAAYVFVR